MTIEDAVELQLQQRHRIRLESRPANIEGKGLVSIRDLVRNALRMRPDRIVVGEVRGAEALDMLQALNTGHSGTFSTVHADNAVGALERISSLALSAYANLNHGFVRSETANAVNYVVHAGRDSGGHRCVTEVIQVDGYSQQTNSFVTEQLYKRGN